MDKNFSVIMGILVLFMFLSGCTTTTSQDLNKTFSQGGITFNYPKDWQIESRSSAGDIVGSGRDVQDLVTLVSPNGIILHVSKANLSSSNLTIDVLKEATIENIKNSAQGQVLNETNTTVGGLIVYEVLMNVKDPKTITDQKILSVITGKDGQSAYYIQFIAENSTFDSNRDLINKILNTRRIE